ncbi:MAG: arsenate reductase and related protein, glutaredoxin family [Linnemannia gamsii]|nr:hypothetical protein BGX24_005502 [Mortierella sp. AD032]KAK3834965.1 MAG: arsenate reductase and related protein, glutaredoxin family [Linnemannia gamsii]
MSTPKDITFFHNPKCSTSRKAQTLLSETSATINTVEYLKTPLTRDQVRDILTYLDAETHPEVIKEFLRKDAPEANTIEKAQDILEQDPGMMQRPLVVDWSRKKAVIGRPAEAVLDIVKD